MRKIILCLCIFTAVCGLGTAQETGIGPGAGSFVLGVDAAYYPKTDKVAGGTHFASLTGAYSAFELRGTGTYHYVIPVPFSNHPLLRGNTLTLSPAVELTPVSLSPKFDVAFSPIAFLVFYVGGRIGTGWDLAPMGVKGLAVFDENSKEYESVVPFASYMYQWYLEGLFQFDLAAVLPGEWNHVVTQTRYKFLYEGCGMLAGIRNSGGGREQRKRPAAGSIRPLWWWDIKCPCCYSWWECRLNSRDILTAMISPTGLSSGSQPL